MTAQDLQAARAKMLKALDAARLQVARCEGAIELLDFLIEQEEAQSNPNNLGANNG